MSTSAERMRRLRERRAAGLIPVDGPAPLPLDEQLRVAVDEAIEAAQLGEADQAAAQVARRLADTIDRASNPAYPLRHLGPVLLRALTELQMTPVSRAARKPGQQRPSQLDALRRARRPGA